MKDRLDLSLARLEARLERRLNALLLWLIGTGLGYVGLGLGGLFSPTSSREASAGSRQIQHG